MLYKLDLIYNIESVQRAKKLTLKLKNVRYNDRLKILKLLTLNYRRYRRDIIEMYKELTDKYDNSIMPKLGLNEFSKTRGNNLNQIY